MKNNVNFYKVSVRGTEIFRDFPSNVSEPEWETIKIGAKKVGIAWYCLNQDSGRLDLSNPYQRRNVSLRIKNFAVGERGVYSANDDYFRQQGFVTIDSPENLDWYIGEVHILDTEIIPDTPRRRLEDDANSRKVIGKLREFYNGLTSATRVHSAYVSGKKHIDDAKKVLTQFKSAESADKKDDKRASLSKLFTFLERDEKKSQADSKSKVEKEKAKALAMPELRDERRALIQEITTVLRKGTQTKTTKKTKKETGTPKTASGNGADASDMGAESQLAETINNPEMLFQAITKIVSEVLDEDSEEYLEISRQIEKLFKRLGLF
jgi:hypothetical protein